MTHPAEIADLVAAGAKWAPGSNTSPAGTSGANPDAAPPLPINHYYPDMSWVRFRLAKANQYTSEQWWDDAQHQLVIANAIMRYLELAAKEGQS